MRNLDKRSLVFRRLFDATCSGKVQMPPGLSADERIALALSLASPIFEPAELAWLRTPDPCDEFRQQIRRPPVATSRRKRVGLLQSELARVGGIETWLRTMLKYVDGVDFVGVVATIGQAYSHTDGISVPTGQGLADAVDLVDSVDVVVVSNEFNLAKIMRKAKTKPRVLLVHHGDETCEWSARAVMSQIGLIDTLVAVNPAVKDRFGASVRTECIASTVDESRCAPLVDRRTLRAEVDIPQHADVVLYSGRFSTEKGTSLAKAIGESLPDNMYLVMMGGPPEPPRPRIRYVGHQKHPGNWYHGADVAISTSLQEGFGLSMLEIITAGLPLVATPRGVAQMHPTIARIVPCEAEPKEWVRCLELDLSDAIGQLDRVEHAQRVINTHYGRAAFVRLWNKLLSE